MMKEALLMGQIHKIGDILDFGWQYKKQTAGGVSSPLIDELYTKAREAGASGGKISGAGGGGFMMIYAPGNARYSVIKALEPYGGLFYPFDFTHEGLTTWTIYHVSYTCYTDSYYPFDLRLLSCYTFILLS